MNYFYEGAPWKRRTSGKGCLAPLSARAFAASSTLPASPPQRKPCPLHMLATASTREGHPEEGGGEEVDEAEERWVGEVA